MAEARILQYNIGYRRVEHTNELVINGNVYDKIEGMAERAHTLEARLDGHWIVAGFSDMQVLYASMEKP